MQFAVSPLCMPYPIHIDTGVYELDQFMAGMHEERLGWVYDKNSEDSMIACVQSISNAIDIYLLPFFDSCCDCKSSLEEMIKLEKLLDNNRKQWLHRIGEQDKAAPLQELSLFDSRKYYMALKSNNWNYAYQYLDHQIKSCKSSLKSFDDPNGPKQPNIVKERYIQSLAEYSEQMDKLQSQDYCYFIKLVDYNEKQMKEFLATKYPKLRQG